MMPIVIEQTQQGERAYDLPSKLLQERIILVTGGVTEQMAREVVAQLLYLDSISDDLIRMKINSPGGSVHAGLAIADQMEQCRSPIQTECSGMAASMGCFLLACGTPGLRLATRRASIMAHQVSAGTEGHVHDMRISFAHTESLNTILMGELGTLVGQDHKQFMIDCDRDKWMTAVEARDYGSLGFIDKVLGIDCGNVDHKFFDASLVRKDKKTKVAKVKKEVL